VYRRCVSLSLCIFLSKISGLERIPLLAAAAAAPTSSPSGTHTPISNYTAPSGNNNNNNPTNRPTSPQSHSNRNRRNNELTSPVMADAGQPLIRAEDRVLSSPTGNSDLRPTNEYTNIPAHSSYVSPPTRNDPVRLHTNEQLNSPPETGSVKLVHTSCCTIEGGA
jgi:hypothetical protein